MFSTEPVLATLLAVIFSAEYVSTEKYMIGAIVIIGVLSAQIEDFFPQLFKK
jgi:drug/metabolite transporter (DMT)-like permease